jgi:hypothetical protein
MGGADQPVPDAGQPPPGGPAGPGGPSVDARGQARRLWRTVYQKAADAAEGRTRALLNAHRYRLHGREALAIVLDGGGQALTTGEKCDLELPWAYQLEAWALYADQVGSLVVDLQTAASISAYPTTASICGGSPPTLTGAQAARSEDVGAWTQGLPQGTVLRVRVNSAATVTLATLTLHLRPIG